LIVVEWDFEHVSRGAVVSCKPDTW
jgi:hypothetical protein